MKYLIINGSPHKHNTWSVVMEAKRVIEEMDAESTFSEVQLSELNLPFCTGCSNCFRKGGEYCPHKDIMNEMIAKLDEADGVIVATTTFNCRETALLKNFLDHLCYMLHRPRFFTKKALVVTTVGGFGGGATIKSVSGTLCGMGMNRCYGLCIRSISWNAYNMSAKHKQYIQKKAGEFCADVISGKMHYPVSSVLIPYNLFRGMSDIYKVGEKFATQDGVYYQDSYRRTHVYDQQIPLLPHQKLMGTCFYTIGKMSGKHMIVTYHK